MNMLILETLRGRWEEIDSTWLSCLLNIESIIFTETDEAERSYFSLGTIGPHGGFGLPAEKFTVQDASGDLGAACYIPSQDFAHIEVLSISTVSAWIGQRFEWKSPAHTMVYCGLGGSEATPLENDYKIGIHAFCVAEPEALPQAAS